MKSPPRFLAVSLLGLAGCLGGFAESKGQGPLTPPGPPAPSMNSLDQLGPRIPLESVALPSGGYSITASGSYFASKMLSRGSSGAAIFVAASDVTIDFNGFGVVETSGFNNVAVLVDTGTPRNNLKICNGSFSGPSITVVQGLTGGTTLGNLELCDLRITSTDGIGIIIDENLTLANPSARQVQFFGLSRGLVFQTGNFQTGGTITECNGSNLTISGRNALRAGVVTHSTIQDSTFDANGLAVISGGTVSHCQLQGITANGQGVIGIEAGTSSECSVSDLGRSGSAAVLFGMVGNVQRGCVVGGLKVTAASGYVIAIVGTVVDSCSVFDITSTGHVVGITGFNSPNVGVVSRCTVRDIHAPATANGANTNGGIVAPVVTDCSVDSIYSGGVPIVGIAGDNVRGCKVGRLFGGDSNASAGIAIGQGSFDPGLVSDCTVSVGPFTGIIAKQSGMIRNCTISGTVGIMVNSAGVTVDGCTIASSAVGVAVTVDSTSNLVIRNHVSGTMFPFFAGANVRLGPVVSGAGGVITNTNPWANFAD